MFYNHTTKRSKTIVSLVLTTVFLCETAMFTITWLEFVAMEKAGPLQTYDFLVLSQTKTSMRGEGLVTFEYFLGCAHHQLLCDIQMVLCNLS